MGVRKHRRLRAIASSGDRWRGCAHYEAGKMKNYSYTNYYASTQCCTNSWSDVGSAQLGSSAAGMTAGDAMQFAHHVQHVLTDKPGSQRQVGGSSATQPVR